MRLSQHLRALLATALMFLPMAAIGTMSHELGHMTAAWALGYHVVLHYGSMSWEDSAAPNVERMDAGEFARHVVVVTMAGPISNMVIGTGGLVWLWVLRRRSREWDAWKWTALVLALFWSRQLFNLATAAIQYVATGSIPLRGDETRLALAMGLPVWSLLAATGILAAAACITALRWFPAARRTQLALGGVAGCLAGFALWYGLLGPLLLP